MNYFASQKFRETVLIGDIGGTNARFALVGPDGIGQEQVVEGKDYSGIADAMAAYLKQTDARGVRKAAMAVAGPVDDINDHFEMTNSVWDFSISETKKKLGLESFRLVNDFAAIAMAVPHLKQGGDYRQVMPGTAKPHAPIGIVGPGTGLGMASLVWNGKDEYVTVSGEGGHATMPAKTQREFDVFQQILKNNKEYSHISAERVVSGKGLVNIYSALRSLDGRTDLPDLPPEEVSKRAVEKSCDACVEALDLMMGFLGSVAGDLALTNGTHGGIYIAGGIVPKLGDYFDRSRFREEFLAKGRFKDYLAPMPVNLITNKFPAFVGLHADLMRSAAPRP